MDASPHVTAAALVQRGEKFLFVEEWIDGHTVLSQPGGHVEPGEPLLIAAQREALEEAGVDFKPSGLVGIYQFQRYSRPGMSLRFVFSGEAQAVPDAKLDSAIETLHWLGLDELRDSATPLRNPSVTQCIEDYLSQGSAPLARVRNLLDAGTRGN